MQTESRQQASLQRSIASELEWVNSNAKGQQKKGKARLRRYEDLTQQVSPLLRLDSPKILVTLSLLCLDTSKLEVFTTLIVVQRFFENDDRVERGLAPSCFTWLMSIM